MATDSTSFSVLLCVFRRSHFRFPLLFFPFLFLFSFFHFFCLIFGFSSFLRFSNSFFVCRRSFSGKILLLVLSKVIMASTVGLNQGNFLIICFPFFPEMLVGFNKQNLYFLRFFQKY